MKQSEVIEELKSTIKRQIEKVEEFKSLGELALSTNPAKDSWNALQCLEHLNRYADFYVKEIGTRLRHRGSKTRIEDDVFNAGYWGNKFIKSMKPDENGQIKKMNTFKSKNPSLQEAKTDSLERFLEYQEQWLSILDKAKEFDLNKNKCSLTIPIIKMNLGATMQFVIAHQERHINQAERALSAVEA
ncbi:MAG: hypothetical protein CMP59_02650 [Flavobacteriales bacterium]|nr:hypothetical protein [Flavobacteriales bacterium]|tara:strand:- start:905 stop:1465 length:561 start_codon:yes stop_codon:yes gene_type:complete